MPMPSETQEVIACLSAAFNEFHEAVLDYFEVSFRGRPLTELSPEEVEGELESARHWHVEHSRSIRKSDPQDGVARTFQLLTPLEEALAHSCYEVVAKEYFRIASALRADQRVWLAGTAEHRGQKANHLTMLALVPLAATKVQIANLRRYRR